MRIGVDLGGTKIEAVALDDAGAILLRRRIATPREDYHGTIAAITGLAQGVERELGARGSVGIGIPGTISPASGLIKNANSTWLNGRPFHRDTATALDRPVRMQNDANCFALSEAVDGAAAGAAVVFGVILGTGVGGGVVVEGRSLIGGNAIAGEWGHGPLPWPRDEERPGPACYCGKHGCIETFLSGPALVRDYVTAHGTTGGATSNVQEIVAKAAAGEAAAEAALARHEDRLARGLAQVINILDPDVIVLGGGLSNLERLYRNLPGLIPALVFSDRITTEIRPPHHGDSSGVRGAAWLWRPDEVADAIGAPPGQEA